MSLRASLNSSVDNSSGPVDIPITARGPFGCDLIFSEALKFLSPKWIALLGCGCRAKEDSEEAGRNMDNVTFQSDKFQVVVDCRGFLPQDIRCFVTKDVVEMLARAENSDQNQDEVMQRNTAINRSYSLPQPINPNEAVCNLSSDGFLVISAPWL